MNVTLEANHEQSTLWNGVAGTTWVEAQELLDRLFQPFQDLLVEAVAARSAREVLDVGCGTGSTTLAVARLLGAQAKGRSVGLDISEPMIAVARGRAEREGTPASFICADAQTHAFEPASFDAIISRFGVMFFDDSVQAFANLRRAVRGGAEMQCLTWRSPAENAFMTAAERAAAPFLPNIPARVADAPGQFAFADNRRVRRLLEQSGWTEIDIQPIDVACAFPEEDLDAYLTRIGPLGRILHTADEQTRKRVTETVRAAFDPYLHGAEVRFNAACWMVGARSPAN